MSRWLLLLLVMAVPAWAATDFDALPVIENCNHTNALTASGNWSSPMVPGNTAVWEGRGTQCDRSDSGTQASAWWNVSTFGPDMAMAMSVPDATALATNFFALWVRVQSPGTSGYDGYVCFFSPDSDDIEVNRYDNAAINGAAAVNCGPIPTPISSGDRVACEAIGTSIKAWVKRGSVWTEECELIDSAYGVGAGAIHVNSTSYRFDDIQAGTLESAASPSRPGLMPVIQ